MRNAESRGVNQEKNRDLQGLPERGKEKTDRQILRYAGQKTRVRLHLRVNGIGIRGEASSSLQTRDSSDLKCPKAGRIAVVYARPRVPHLRQILVPLMRMLF